MTFHELAGSPVEHYSSDGFTARRMFLVAWNDREALARDLLGDAAGHGGRPAATYPGKASVVVASVRFEPFVPDHLERLAVDESGDSLACYGGSFARAVVEYRTVPERDREDGPANPVGTHLAYRMEPVTDTQRLLPGGWTWQDNGQPAPAGLEILRAVPMTDHLLTWREVIAPPWAAIAALQGKINAAAFLGCPAGTLLFVGAEANKLYRAGLDAAPSAFAWEIRYRLRERAIKHAGQRWGWNAQWRDSPAGWAELALYESADFGSLFLPAE